MDLTMPVNAIASLESARNSVASLNMTLFSEGKGGHKHFLLKRDDDESHLAVHIILSGNAICLFGDPMFMPLQYIRDSDWFLKKMPHADYLAEKFMSRKWYAERAAADLHDHMDCEEWKEDCKDKDSWITLAKDLEGGRYSEDGGEYPFADEMSSIDSDYLMDVQPGWEFDEADKNWLFALHERFHKLYWENFRPEKQQEATET